MNLWTKGSISVKKEFVTTPFCGVVKKFGRHAHVWDLRYTNASVSSIRSRWSLLAKCFSFYPKDMGICMLNTIYYTYNYVCVTYG